MGWTRRSTHYRQALRIDPEFARAEYMLGVALAGRGRLDEANDRDRRALQNDPEGAKANVKTRGLAVAMGIIHYKQTLCDRSEAPPLSATASASPRETRTG